MSRFAPLAALALAACAHTGPVDSAAAPSTRVGQFTSGAEGFDTHSWWVDTGAEVVVFDAQFTPALAEEVLAQIRATTDSPVRYVVALHPNPDKFNGASVFQAVGAELVVSEATAAAMPGVHAYKEAWFTGVGMFAPGAYPVLPSPDRTFSGELVLDTAVPVELFELSHPGVSSTQTIARVGDHVFVGDLVGGRAHGWLEGGIVDGAPAPDLDQWRAALAELGDRVGDDALVHPGRGTSLPAGTVLPEMDAWLGTASDLVDGWLGEMADPRATLASEEAGAAYAELTTRFEAAYPAWTLSYLVTYGAYGLATTRAAE